MKHNRQVIAALIALLVLAGCPASNLTPLQKAQLAYTDFADGYTLAMQTAVKLRSNGQINDAQWMIIDTVQKQVRAQQPIVRGLLDQWAATQVQPPTLPSQMATLTSNLATIQAVNNTAGGK